MYRQFCLNLENYMTTQEEGTYRYNLGRMLTCVVDDSKDEYDKSYLISILTESKSDSHAVKKLLFELWAYGVYDNSNDDLTDHDKRLVSDLSKLVELLYGSSYWSSGLASEDVEEYKV